jgi:hypothetical protein
MMKGLELNHLVGFLLDDSVSPYSHLLQSFFFTGVISHMANHTAVKGGLHRPLNSKINIL